MPDSSVTRIPSTHHVVARMATIDAAPSTVVNGYPGIRTGRGDAPLRSQRRRKARWVRKIGSAQESGELRILCGFLKNQELGLGGGQPLRLEQQVVQVAVAAATT